jgi:hypothetical protein
MKKSGRTLVLGAAYGAIALEDLAREEQGWLRHRRQGDAGFAQHGVERFDRVEPHGQLGVDRIVDQQRALDGGGVELSDRPVRSMRIVGDDVQEDVGVDERHLNRHRGSGL